MNNERKKCEMNHLICRKIFNLVIIKVKIKAMAYHVAKCASNFTRGKTK